MFLRSRCLRPPRLRLAEAPAELPRKDSSPTYLVNLSITNASGGGARPPAVQGSESDRLEGTGSRGPDGRASRAGEGGNAAAIQVSSSRPQLARRRAQSSYKIAIGVVTYLLNILPDDNERSVMERREVG